VRNGRYLGGTFRSFGRELEDMWQWRWKRNPWSMLKTLKILNVLAPGIATQSIFLLKFEAACVLFDSLEMSWE